MGLMRISSCIFETNLCSDVAPYPPRLCHLSLSASWDVFNGSSVFSTENQPQK